MHYELAPPALRHPHRIAAFNAGSANFNSSREFLVFRFLRQNLDASALSRALTNGAHTGNLCP